MLPQPEKQEKTECDCNLLFGFICQNILLSPYFALGLAKREGEQAVDFVIAALVCNPKQELNLML